MQSMNRLRWLGLMAAALLIGFAQPASAASNTESTQKAINFLSGDVKDWVGSQGCAACHRAGAALYAMASAKANGYNMAATAHNGLTNSVNMEFVAQRVKGEQLANGSWTHGGSYTTTKTSYAAFGLAGYDNFVSTQYSNSLVSVSNWALASQQASGRWVEDHGTYPTTFGNVPVTGRMMVALAQAKQRVDPAKAAQFQASLDKAATYIRNNLNNNGSSAAGDGINYTHEISWAIVGLKAAGAGANGVNTTAINTLADRLMARTANGFPAWGALQNSGYDSYSTFHTGIAIYALCLAGREPDVGGRLSNAMNWLKSQQAPGGYWGSGGFIDIPTTFASLGLSCFGDHSVLVTVVPPDRQVVEFSWPEAQEVTYFVKVKNRGFEADTFALSAAGGLPGWTSALSQSSIFLPAGAEGTIQLKVTVPPNQFPSLSSEVTVTAVSGANPGVSGSARVLTYTNPPPPTTGRETITTILTPAANASVTVGEAVTLSARVNAKDNGELVKGPGKGVVTFFVAGVAIGADNDADGNGVFSVPWNPNSSNWNATGPQDYRAVFSGVTLQPNAPNLLGSTASQTLNIKAYPYAPPSVTQCNINNPYINTLDIRVCGFVTPKQNGAVVNYIAFIINGGAPIVVAPTPENMSGGFVETMAHLNDGANVIQLTATDTFGGITTKQITVFVDRVAPALTIVAPGEGQAFSSSTVNVTSTVDDRSPVRVDTNYIVSSNVDAGGGTVTHTVNFPNRGLNTLIVTATDRAGNITEERLQVWVDYKAPVVTTTPNDGAIVGPKANNLLPYTVRVDSLSATTVEIGGQSYALARGGGVVQVALPVAPGINNIPIKVKSETGLVTTLARTVKYDVAAPVAVTTIPTAGGTYSGTITLTARVTDNLSNITAVGFMRNRSGIRAGVAGANNTWTLSFDTNELPDGKHTINVRVADAVGNVAIYDTEFFVNNSGARVGQASASKSLSGGSEGAVAMMLVAGEDGTPTLAPACPEEQPAPEPVSE
ncbi:Ig-like domain-containing protein [Myxococcaceae bacterium GXIMD 01537]